MCVIKGWRLTGGEDIDEPYTSAAADAVGENVYALIRKAQERVVAGFDLMAINDEEGEATSISGENVGENIDRIFE